MCEAIGDTYSGLLEHSLKKSTKDDACFVIEEAFKLLFEMATSNSISEQRAASVCILRIIKSSPSTYFTACSEFLVKNLVEVLGKKNSEAAQACIESLLVIVLSSSKEMRQHIDDVLGVLVLHIGNVQPGVRKVALDTIISLCIISPEEMGHYKEEILEAISIVKNDQDRRVREAYQEAIDKVDALPGEVTESDITNESRLQKSQLNNAKSRIKDTSTTVGSIDHMKDDKKKAKQPPKRDGSALNKKNINPNFMKASSSEIEIFYNDKKPAKIAPQSHAQEVNSEVLKRANARNERGGISDRSHPMTDFIESRIENEVMTDPHSMADTRMEPGHLGIDQPSHIPMRRGPDESNIFKDFENDRDFVHSGHHLNKGNRMDEEKRRSPINRRHPPESVSEGNRFNRSRTPEGEYRYQMPDERRRQLLSEEDQIIDKLVDKTSESIHQKIVKTNDYELKILKKTCEGLKKENTAQLKIIEFQTKRIDSLVSHVQNMTLHINHLLGKVNQLEQNMFQISATRQQTPQQIILPSYGYPIPGQTTSMDQSHQPGGLLFPSHQNSSTFLGGIQSQTPIHQVASSYVQLQAPGFSGNPRGWQADSYQADHGMPPRHANNQIDHGMRSKEMMNNGGISGAKSGLEGSSGKGWTKGARDSSQKGKSKGGRWIGGTVEEDEDEEITTERVDNGTFKRENDKGFGETNSSNLKKKKEMGNEKELKKEISGNKTESLKLKTKDLKELNYGDENRASANFMYAESTVQGAFDEERGSNLDTSPIQNSDKEEIELDDLNEDDDEETNDVSEALKVVLVKDNRKILDYLADDSNLNQFESLTPSTVKKLGQKLSELLLCRIESYIEIVIPWLIACVESRLLQGSSTRGSLLSSLKSVLTSGKGSKTYKQELLQTLEALKRDLEKQ